ncbi:hypothetical protein BELL_0014g00270 [Botrytis elliptica]|uniref:Uncharacterized protein n=1 Tax=Botrytis elliptica TaxID=278938 RepID=A0A4Z1K300_9HELO|nr:hypothetical protein BELL_0014g00270 [Botrytis elliptica]
MPDIYIHNRTCLPLSLALTQVGPLYYENNVLPGHSMKRHVGSVHFTIQAKVFNRTTESKFDEKDNILPILGLTIGALTLGAGGALVAATGATVLASVAGIGAGLGSSVAVPAWSATAIAIGSPIVQAGTMVGVGTTAGMVMSNMKDGKKVVDSMGWYMGFSERHFYIGGGPKADKAGEYWIFDPGTMTDFYVTDKELCPRKYE